MEARPAVVAYSFPHIFFDFRAEPAQLVHRLGVCSLATLELSRDLDFGEIDVGLPPMCTTTRQEAKDLIVRCMHVHRGCTKGLLPSVGRWCFSGRANRRRSPALKAAAMIHRRSNTNPW